MFYLGLVFFKLIGFGLSLLPRQLFLALGRGIGKILLLCEFRTSIARSNLQLAFPELSIEQREKILSGNFAHMGVVFLEFLRSFYRFENFIEKNVRFENVEIFREMMQEKKGVLILTAHVGNWEALCGAGAALERAPILMVTKKLKPDWFHRIVEITRELIGIKMAFEPQTLSSVKAALKKNSVVGFVMDQYAGAPVGARVNFFNIPVGSHTALAKLALRYQREVLPALAYRDAKGFYMIRFENVLPLLKGKSVEESVLLNTQAQVAQTEKWVREFPEQWLWVHKRWKGNLSPLPTNSLGELLRG